MIGLLLILILLICLMIVLCRNKVDKNIIIVISVVIFIILYLYVNNKELFNTGTETNYLMGGPDKISDIQNSQTKEIDLLEKQLKLVNNLFQDSLSTQTTQYKKIPVVRSCTIPSSGEERTAQELKAAQNANQEVPYYLRGNITAQDLSDLQTKLSNL